MENQNFNKVFNILESTGLNWTVNKHPLHAEVDGQKIPTEAYGMFRNDNNMFLGTMRERYTPFQNYQMAETIVAAADGLNLPVSNGGALQDGRKVFLQVELDSQTIGNSDIKRQITVLNSHDGSAAIGFGSSNTVVVCQNTFYKAYKEIQKFRHTVTADARIKLAIADLRTAIGLDVKLMENFMRMADIKADDAMAARILKAVFEIDADTKESDISTRKSNQLVQAANAIQTDVSIHGNDLWAVFNGITRYTNHVATKPENKTEYVMSGQGHKTNLIAYDEIMAWIEEHSPKQYAMV